MTMNASLDLLNRIINEVTKSKHHITPWVDIKHKCFYTRNTSLFLWFLENALHWSHTFLYLIFKSPLYINIFTM